MTEHLPMPPAGIDRDQTEHGKIYFTRRQLIAYGEKCFEAGLSSLNNVGKTDANKGTAEILRELMRVNK